MYFESSAWIANVVNRALWNLKKQQSRLRLKPILIFARTRVMMLVGSGCGVLV